MIATTIKQECEELIKDPEGADEDLQDSSEKDQFLVVNNFLEGKIVQPHAILCSQDVSLFPQVLYFDKKRIRKPSIVVINNFLNQAFQSNTANFFH